MIAKRYFEKRVEYLEVSSVNNSNNNIDINMQQKLQSLDQQYRNYNKAIIKKIKEKIAALVKNPKSRWYTNITKKEKPLANYLNDFLK